ncbi:putative ribonuclease H-like domain-containing protein [Tanacetum coccineum]
MARSPLKDILYKNFALGIFAILPVVGIVLPPKTTEEILARERERKARTTLLMALLEDHLAKFHKMTDAKEMWGAIKSRSGGNDESKKMQKYILKQQFEGFSVSNSEGLHKGYDKFQSLLSQLEIHGAGVSTEDANQKFLSATELSSLFISDKSKSTSSTNNVSTAYGVSTSSGYNSQRENSLSYTDELMYSFFANQSNGPHLDHEDLEQLDEFDLEEMDLKWKVAMISMRLKKFYKKTGRRLQFDAKESVGFDKTKVECYNYHNTGHFARECKSKGNQDSRRRDAWNIGYRAKDNGMRPGKQEEPKALVTLDEEGVDWTGHVDDEQENFTLMAYRNSGSDTKVEGMQFASSPPMTGNYMPQDLNRECRRFYVSPMGPKQSKTSELIIKLVNLDLVRVNTASDKNLSSLKLAASSRLARKVNHETYMCDKKNKVLFTDTECLMLSSDFKLSDENQVLLRVPRQNNIYSFNLENIVPSGDAKNEGVKHTKDIGLKINEEPVDQEDQAFLEELKRLKRQENEANDVAEVLRKEFAQSTEDLLLQAGAAKATSTNTVNTVITPLNDSQIPALKDIYGNSNDGIFTNASYDDEGAVANFTNLESTMNVSPIPTLRIHFTHPTTQILGDPKSAVQTRSKVNKSSRAHAFISYIQKKRRNNHKDFQHCLFACFLSQIEPKKISEALEDENLPYGKKAIETKWVYRNKQDERGVVVRNKARIEAIRIFLAFASYMGFIVYHMDVKSAFLYDTIDEEVYVSQPPGFVDPKFPKKFYKVVKALYGLHQAPRAWYATLSTFLLKSGYKKGTINKTLFIKKDKSDIMLVQIASTPVETQKPLTKDEKAANVDVHLYRFMIGSLMYLTTSRPDIMFVVCAFSRFQVTPKTSHLNVVKRIFRYLKGKPKLGLWYPRVSSFDLEAYSDSDYAGANLDRKSTTGGCQFLGRRLISWQCKKQTIVATSTIEAE